MLPPVLQQVAEVLPIGHTVDAMRAALLDGAATAQILPQLGALGLFTVIALPLSLVAFNAGLRRARVTGTLGHL